MVRRLVVAALASSMLMGANGVRDTGDRVNMVSPTGETASVPIDRVAGFGEQGWKVETPGQAVERVGHDVRERSDLGTDVNSAIPYVLGVVAGGVAVGFLIFVRKRPPGSS